MAWANDLSGLMAGAQSIPQVDPSQAALFGNAAMSGMTQGIQNNQADWQNERTRALPGIISSAWDPESQMVIPGRELAAAAQHGMLDLAIPDVQNRVADFYKNQQMIANIKAMLPFSGVQDPSAMRQITGNEKVNWTDQPLNPAQPAQTPYNTSNAGAKTQKELPEEPSKQGHQSYLELQKAEEGAARMAARDDAMAAASRANLANVQAANSPDFGISQENAGSAAGTISQEPGVNGELGQTVIHGGQQSPTFTATQDLTPPQYAPGKDPGTPAGIYDYLWNMQAHPWYSQSLSGGVGGNRDIQNYHLIDNAPQNVVNDVGFKLQSLGDLSAQKKGDLSIGDVNAGLDAWQERKRASVGPAPVLAPTRTKDGTFLPPDPQEWMKQMNEWQAKRDGVVQEAQSLFGNAFAEKLKMDMDYQERQNSVQQAQNAVTSANNSIKGLNNLVQGINKDSGAKIGNGQALQANTFGSITDAQKFGNQVAAYKKIPDTFPSNVSEIQPLIKNLMTADNVSETQAAEELLTATVAPANVQAALALLHGAPAEAIYKTIGNITTQGLGLKGGSSLVGIKRNMAIHDMWNQHTIGQSLNKQSYMPGSSTPSPAMSTVQSPLGSQDNPYPLDQAQSAPIGAWFRYKDGNTYQRKGQ